MGDAVAARLNELRDVVCTHLGEPPAWADAIGAVVEVTCRYWPVEHMTKIARRQTNGTEALDALAVIAAKVREDLEHRYGMGNNVAVALNRLCQPVVVEVANIWFASPENRVAVRSCCREAWRIA